jgi:hypothetical protein
MAWHLKKFLYVLGGHLILMNFAGWKEEGSYTSLLKVGGEIMPIYKCEIHPVKYHLAPTPYDLCIGGLEHHALSAVPYPI